MNNSSRVSAEDVALDLDTQLRAHNVPGASLAVLVDGEVHQTAAGVLNRDTQMPVANESMFQIGSISKAFTSTLVMKLVADGLIDLDSPVQSYLSDFTLADADVARQISVRHLLTHTSGVEGDFFVDTGRGEDRHERFVDEASLLPQLHSVGMRFSYCNTGYIIAGRLIEVVSGLTWDEAMRQWLFTPLKMKHAATLPEDLVGRSTAMGHVLNPKGQGEPRALENAYSLPFSAGPAGSAATMSVGDLMRFVQFHLDGGLTSEGCRLVPEKDISNMRNQEIALPKYAATAATFWGVGWALYDWGSRRLVGHDGDTVGQLAFLRFDPQERTAFALLTNGGDSNGLCETLLDEIYVPIVGAGPPERREPDPDCSFDLSIYPGFYERMLHTSEVYLNDGLLCLRTREDPDDPSSLKSFLLEPIEKHVFQFWRSRVPRPFYIQFDDFDESGRPTSVFSGFRMARRSQKPSKKGTTR